MSQIYQQRGTARSKGPGGDTKEQEDGVVQGSSRRERELPPNLDEKQRRRILRNRASAERSRLKRLGQIERLEEENQSLRMQLQTNGGGGGGGGDDSNLAAENHQLKNELQILSERVRTLTALLVASRDQQQQQRQQQQHLMQQMQEHGGF